MRRRRLKKLWRRLDALRQQRLSRDQLLLKLGAAKKEAGQVYALVDIRLPGNGQPVGPATFSYSLHKDKLRATRRREGRYLILPRYTQPDRDQLLLLQRLKLTLPPQPPPRITAAA